MQKEAQAYIYVALHQDNETTIQREYRELLKDLGVYAPIITTRPIQMLLNKGGVYAPIITTTPYLSITVMRGHIHPSRVIRM